MINIHKDMEDYLQCLQKLKLIYMPGCHLNHEQN